MKVKFRLDTGYAGVFHEDEVWFDDDITDAELDAEAEQWAWEHVDLNWERLDD